MTSSGTGVRWGSGQARGVLAATIVGSGMAMLDGTIVNVALPKIGAELGASVTGLQWVIDGYLLSLAALILVAGSLGDRYGRRRVYQLGVAWFGITSVLCGIAPTTEVLVAARVLQGVGGALLTPGSLAILQSAFAHDDRARAIGAWSGLSGVATAVGPLLGGLLVQAGSWRLAFLINVPVALLCLWLTRRYVPESCDGELTGRPDFTGTALGAIGLAGVTAALVEAPARGVADPLVLVAGLVGVLALVAFCVLQARSADPLVPPELFADRTFLLSNLLTFLLYAALGGVMMLMVMQLQVSLHYSPVAAGLSGLPITILMLLLSARSGRLAQRIGPRLQLVVGPILVGVGMLLLRMAEPGASYLTGVLPGVLVFGLGLAAAVAPVTATVLAAAPDRHAGVASGVNNAVARTGSLLAVAVLPAVAGIRGDQYTDPVALTAGWQLALLVCAAAAAVGGLFALGVDNGVLRNQQPPPPAELDGALACGVDGPPTHLTDKSTVDG
ncbi:MFS transporter [Kutzneria viridogrisea]|uniref:EmrB/QacA subfamily drug resistance transporter n=1 Tax=Kutzneria viridogrisea TaxID=47990 RepID=A0ABR6BW36_9PSEU|nr:EmrB/QacA subfamily drug resistance transporter [Kutzneria viridogrisea]